MKIVKKELFEEIIKKKTSEKENDSEYKKLKKKGTF